MAPATILHILDLAGVAVFAVSGALTAGRSRMDLLGAFVVAALTAVGGGTLRDLLLDRNPIFWLGNPSYLVVIAVATGLTVLYASTFTPPRASLRIADALGLGFFTISGAQIAERTGVPALSVILLGTMTGAAGGVLRDVICNEIPLILRPGELYATTCIAGATVYVVLRALHVAPGIAALGGIVLIIALRFASILWGLTLPELRMRREDERR